MDGAPRRSPQDVGKISTTASATSDGRETRMRFHFVGDGLHCGDGGSELQRVWLSVDWRPIPKCDGRYVCREHRLSVLSLAALCNNLNFVAASPVLRCREHTATTDAADVVRFYGGGGIISYVKSGGAHVHTLNTESGLCRKLIGMGAGCTRLLSASLSREAACCFDALCCLLRATPEPERTTVAPALAVALRFGLARPATSVTPVTPAASASPSLLTAAATQTVLTAPTVTAASTAPASTVATASATAAPVAIASTVAAAASLRSEE